MPRIKTRIPIFPNRFSPMNRSKFVVITFDSSDDGACTVVWVDWFGVVFAVLSVVVWTAIGSVCSLFEVVIAMEEDLLCVVATSSFAMVCFSSAGF